MIKQLYRTPAGLMLLFLLIPGCYKGKHPEPEADTIQTVGPDQISTAGELRVRLMKNFDRLEEERYRPDKVFLTEEGSGWWPGDTEGRTILALTKLAQATGRTPKYLDSIIKLFPEKVNKKGYFGTIYPDSVLDEQQLSSQGWVLRGLCEYYLWKKDAKVLTYINRIIDNLVIPTAGFHKIYPIDPSLRKQGGHQIGSRLDGSVGKWILSTDIGCDFIFMDGVVQAYQVTHREELEPVIDEMVTLFRKIDFVGIKAQTHSTLTGLRALLRYFQTTGDSTLILTVEKTYDLYRHQARTENYENYNWFGRPEWTEPCAVIDSYILASWLWQLTGKAEYAEDAQLIYYNALGFEQRENGGFGTDNCSGANTTFLHPDLNEAYWCCTMRGGEGLAVVAQYSFFTSVQSLYVTSFENSIVRFKFDKDSLVLEEKTTYPLKGEVIFEVKETSLSFDPLIMFLAPSWFEGPEIFINGKKIKADIVKSFVCFSTKLNRGDLITYTGKLKSRRLELENPNSMKGYCKYFYGPLMMGHLGKKEIQLPKDAEFEITENGSLRMKNSSLALIPVHHLLKKEVKKESGYQIQVLFKNE
jgi:uncharacterized protein